jgi:hypothetical protein
MTIQEIETKLKSPETLNQIECAEMACIITGEYSFVAGQLDEVLKSKPEKWLQYRSEEGIKSDKAADRLWEASPDGIDETSYRLLLRRYEKMLSVLRLMARIKDRDFNNQRIN